MAPPPIGFDQLPLTYRRLENSRPGVSGAVGKRPTEARLKSGFPWGFSYNGRRGTHEIYRNTALGLAEADR